MKIEDIIYMLNKHIKIERDRLNLGTKGILVLYKSILPHSSIKAYKEVEVCLWYVQGNKKIRVITIHKTLRIINGQEEDIMNNIFNELTLSIFNWMKSESYNKIVKGEI